MGALQCLFRHEGKDVFSGIESYRVVRSIFNQVLFILSLFISLPLSLYIYLSLICLFFQQRIECWWSMMRRHQMEWWINFFKDLEVFGAFQRGNLHHM